MHNIFSEGLLAELALPCGTIIARVICLLIWFVTLFTVDTIISGYFSVVAYIFNFL
jgi:hypothetical protein